MTVDEAIKYVESAWVPGAAPTILAAEVRRLREELTNNKALLNQELERNRQWSPVVKRFDSLSVERDRYREALERIADDYDFTAPENMLYIARDAIRGGEAR